MKMASTLGQMKGAAMKIGQLASFVDVEFLPPRVPRDLPGAAREAAHLRAADALEQVEKSSPRSTRANAQGPLRRVRARGLRGGVDRPGPPRPLHDGRAVAVKIQYPGIAEALEADLRNAGRSCGSARPWRPGSTRRRSPKSCASGCSRSSTTSTRRRTSALRPRLRRPPLHLRARGQHPALAPAGAGHRAVDGHRLRGGQGATEGGAQPLRRDRLPLLLRLDLPPAALQRRLAPGQLPADGRRPRRLPRLRHDQAARPATDRARAAGARTPPSTTTPRSCATASPSSASSRTRRRSTSSACSST